MTKNVTVMKHFETPREEGVWFRLLCLTGELKGQSFVLKGNRIVIGRSEKCDIVLADIKSSREHAELVKNGSEWVATDLGSQNGIMINDQKIKQGPLKDADRLIVGQTVFKFSRLDVRPKLILGESDPFSTGPSKKTTTLATESKKKVSPLVLIAGIVLVGLVIFSGNETPVTKKEVETGPSRVKDVTDEYVQAVRQKRLKEDDELKKKLNVIFQRGLREYREKNYFRAINEFNLALILSPNDSLADFYLRKTKEDLDKVIEESFIKGRRDEDSLKFQSAIQSYCSIIRLIHQYPDDERYKSAQEKILKLEKELGMVEGEANCLKKQPTDQSI